MAVEDYDGSSSNKTILIAVSVAVKDYYSCVSTAGIIAVEYTI